MWKLNPLILVLFAAAALGCGERGDAGAPAEAAPGSELEPEEQMRATLENLTEAQALYHARHGEYAPGTAELIEEYGFVPVGQAVVVINFGGTSPEWRYLATATHPTSDLLCEMVQGRPGPDEPQYQGQIECSEP